MKNFFEKYILGLFSLGTVFLLFYTFTQIDLGLALTRFPALFSVQRAFQSIGYFNRPLSVLLYSVILILLSACYFGILHYTRKAKLKRKDIWNYIFIVTALLTFSYNAFSYDLFNYIFDAKIVTYYHQNPYEHKALDYPHDPMLGFMHWTHRVYPYGPVWLCLTVPLSYAGMHVFLLTFFLFKVFIALCFLGTLFFIEKLAVKLGSKHPLTAVAFFAFNPLVLIESLVSAHNDIVMMFLAVVSIYALIKHHFFSSIVLMVLSVATKFATVFLIPVYLSASVLQYMKVKTSWLPIWGTAIACMSLAVLAASQKSGNFQPWYLLFVLPFAAFFAENPFFAYAAGGASIAIAASYLPFLYLGNWDAPVPTILLIVYIVTAVSVFAAAIYYSIYMRKPSKK